MAWAWLALLYGALKGAREVIKKKAIQKSAVLDVLLLYTLLSFAMVLPDAHNALGLTAGQMGLVAVKSFVIFIGWMCGFYALERMPVSLYGVMDLSQMLFATLLGVICLGERMTPAQMIGLILVTGGLLMLRGGKKGLSDREAAPAKAIGMAMICYLLNAVSGTMDKVLMTNMTSSQLQFWYMLFLCMWYAIYMLARHIPFHWKEALKNKWIWLMAVLFVIGDRALFIANGMEESRVTIMTLLKQISCVATIIGGRLAFKEKGAGYKLLCAGVVVAGIVIAVL